MDLLKKSMRSSHHMDLLEFLSTSNGGVPKHAEFGIKLFFKSWFRGLN